MRIFISGIMQGSITGHGIEEQGYRQQVAAILKAWNPDVEIVDPLEIWPDSTTYDIEKAKATLLSAVELAGQVDAVVAYAPIASMGTAVEMWHAYKSGVPVYTITELRYNWVILTASTQIFHAMEDFAAFVHSDGLSPKAPDSPLTA